MKPIPEIAIMNEDGTLAAGARCTVKEFFKANEIDAKERDEAYGCWRANEPYACGGGAMPRVFVLLVEART